PRLPKTIPTDPQRLQQILNNLLSNAFKFTEKGRVDFRAAPADSGWTLPDLDTAEGVAALTVTDTGIGIPTDMQRSIFEAFAQGDGTTSRKYGGTGLGLSICRELVALLGGEITLQSEPGRGSTFTVYLPAGSIPSPRRRATDDPGTDDDAIASISLVTPEPVLIGATTADPRPHETSPIAVEPRALQRAAAANGGHAHEAVTTRRVLVVEDDAIQRDHVLQTLKT